MVFVRNRAFMPRYSTPITDIGSFIKFRTTFFDETITDLVAFETRLALVVTDNYLVAYIDSLTFKPLGTEVMAAYKASFMNNVSHSI